MESQQMLGSAAEAELSLPDLIALLRGSQANCALKPDCADGCGDRRWALVVEQKLFGVDQRPDDVFVGWLGVLGVFGQVGLGDVQFVCVRLAGIDPAIKFADADLDRPLVGGQLGGPPRRAGDFVLHFAAVEQVQALGEVGVLRAFAFAGRVALRLPEDLQEIRARRSDREAASRAFPRAGRRRAASCAVTW